jgi:hypothetical protein
MEDSVGCQQSCDACDTTRHLAVPGTHAWNGEGFGMIPNAITILIGLWLAYCAIFSTPPGEMNNIQLAIAAIVIVVCAVMARLNDKMSWPGTTNVALGLVLGLLAAVAPTPRRRQWLHSG